MVQSITLQNTANPDIVNNDILGQICFAAPNEASVTGDPATGDSILIAASIFARSEGTFAVDNNATELVFVTGSSESAAPGATNYDMTLSSAGLLTIGGGINVTGGTIAGTMADNSINSDMYVDGSIDTAHIADNQVTLAKMAGITRGSIIIGDASGDPAALAISANDGWVLTSDGTDIAWEAASGGAITALNNATANELVTVGATTTQLDAEANLTYDDTNGLKITSATSALPLLTIENTNDDATGATLKFNKNGTAPVDGDVVGNIDFASEDDGANAHTYARIQSVATDITGGSEQGQIDFYVAETDGTLTKGMDIVGTGYDGAITVDISTHGSHANAGLKLGGTLITSSAAEINLLDGSVSNTVVNSKAVIYGAAGQILGDSFLLKNSGATVMTLNNSGNDILFDCAADITLDADGGTVSIADGGTDYIDFTVSSGPSMKMMYTSATGNYFNMAVGANGVTTLSTVDADGALGHLVLAPNGDLKLEPDSGGVKIKEAAAAAADTAAYGQLWVKSDDPCTLYFTNDDGDDIQITSGDALAGGTVTSVTAGAGMTQSGTSTVNPTLNVIGGNGITANADDVAITAAQTTITSVHNAALVIGRDPHNDIDFATDNNIIFRAGDEDQLTLTDGALTPSADAIVDLGTSSLQFKDAYFHGTLEADAITLGGTALGSLYSVIAGSSSILTVGALDSGSITSNFGTIDTGSSTITTTGVITGGGFTIGSAAILEAELELLDGVTAGTAIASKVVTTDASIDTTGQRNVTITGELDAATLDISGNVDIAGTTNLDTVDIDGNVDLDGNLTMGAQQDGYDIKVFGNGGGTTTLSGADATNKYWMWDESADGVRLRGNFVQEQVPYTNTPSAIATGVSEIDIDWSLGNYYWIKLGDTAIDKIIFRNMKRGGRYILRIQQASPAVTIASSAWTGMVDNDSDRAFTELRWVGGTVPTMSTGTTATDVYGFLCTRSNGLGLDGFVVAQNLVDSIT